MPTVSPASETLTLTLRDTVQIARERVYLSDVVSCKGSKKDCDEISAIDIGTAPKPMRQERLPRARVADAISKELADRSIVWEGKDNCLLTALSSPMNEEAVMHVLEKAFAEAPKGMRVVIQSIRLPGMQILRHNNYLYKISTSGDQVSRIFSNPRTHFAQVKIVAVDQDPSSQASVDFIAQVSLRVEIQALVATQARERGEKLAAENVALEWIPFQDQILTDESLVIGKILKGRIMAKQALRSWDLTREPEVQRGDRVEAVLSSNGVKMNSVAQALEAGFVGQKIRIRLDATKKTLLGTVIARSQVEVPSL